MQEDKQTSCWIVKTLTLIESERQLSSKHLGTGFFEKTVNNIYNFFEREKHYIFNLVFVM